MSDIHKMNEDLGRLIAQHRAGRTPDADQFGAIHRQAIAAAKQAEADDDADAVERALSIADTAAAHRELAEQLEKPIPRKAAPSNPSAMFPPDDREAVAGDTWVDKRTGRVVPVLTRGQKMADLHPEARGLSAGRYVQALLTGNWRGIEAEQALSTSANSGGGFLVPDPLAAQIIDRARSLSVLARLGARFVPMESSTLDIARVTGDPSIVASKVENESFTSSDLIFDRVNLTAHTLGQIVTVSRELIDDAPNASTAIETALAQALATEMDRLMLRGSGSAEPLGVVNGNDVQTTGSIGSISWNDLLDAVEDLYDVNATPTGYVTTPLLAIALEKQTVNSESNHFAEPPRSIRQLQALTSNQVASGELYLADWSTVIIGLRQDIQIEVSGDAGEAFERNQLKIRATWRGDVAAEHGDHLLKLTGATA